MLDQRGLTRADLYECMGGKSRVSEFYSGSRRLSISQILALRDRLGIPADLLIGSDQVRPQMFPDGSTLRLHFVPLSVTICCVRLAWCPHTVMLSVAQRSRSSSVTI